MGISVSITAGKDAASSKIEASGSVMHVITDTERTTFNVQDSSLKSAVGSYHGKEPNDAYVCSPTPWDDLYKRYGWPQVTTNLTLDSATITGMSSEPVIVATKTLTNNSSVPADFDANISESVSNTSTSTWSQTNTIEVGQKFTYDVKFLGSGGGGETSFSYSHSWGESKTESKQVSVGSSSGVKVRLEPKQSVIAKLIASRGVLNVRIVYSAYLSGWTACNYNPTFKGHHFWGLDIDSVMSSGNLSNSRTFTEDIQIGYYSDAQVTLEDPKTSAILASVGPGIAAGTDTEGYTIDLREPVLAG